MGKKFFLLIILLMSIALIGIISVQVFWINKTIQITEEQFSLNVKFALAKVSEEIKQREFDDFYEGIKDTYKEGEPVEDTDVQRYFYEKLDTVNNERFSYTQSIIEQNYKVPTEFFENDTIDYKEIFSKEETLIFAGNSIGTELKPLDQPKESLTKTGRLERLEKANLESTFDAIASRFPIHKRVSNEEITLRLDREFNNRGVTTNFKYGIYDKGLATQVKSGYFRKENGRNYMVPMFANDRGNNNYELYVTFPEKKRYILGSIFKILGLSAFFILIIILAFVSALYQLVRQKQISEIKTDFINNMTHEFKTPIATINLALDAIKNPKIISDKEKVMKYSTMIREENKRMNQQVENVLRISKLEKNQLEVNKEAVDVHDLIEDAITHVNLLIDDRLGSINKHFEAELSEIMANEFHFTNIIVNILDNAIKYSPEVPNIDISTENTAKSIIIKIKDQGIGMNKTVQKNIFKKFYREERGNIHNVKGHGLGLSYVKKIVEMHQGIIYVESEKGIGSTFLLKFPLI
jgi:two-component system phosphate regulon sensor histidine kinase PhoR